MTDPAIEAAQRAWDTTAELTADGQYVLNPYWIAKSAAREMAKSVQELHRRVGGLKATVCEACQVYWPCATALLVYSSEELER